MGQGLHPKNRLCPKPAQTVPAIRTTSHPHYLAIRTCNSIGNLTYDGRQDFDRYPIIIKRPGFFVTRCAKS